MSIFEDVKKFHQFFGHAIGAKPRFLDPERMKNRMKWQDEERQEFLDAVEKGDLAAAADALVDQVYFILGHAVEMGIPFDPIFGVVQKANMSKALFKFHTNGCPLDRDHEIPTRCTCGAVSYKEDGKTSKPPNWVSPDETIKRILEDRS